MMGRGGCNSQQPERIALLGGKTVRMHANLELDSWGCERKPWGGGVAEEGIAKFRKRD